MTSILQVVLLREANRHDILRLAPAQKYQQTSSDLFNYTTFLEDYSSTLLSQSKVEYTMQGTERDRISYQAEAEQEPHIDFEPLEESLLDMSSFSFTSSSSATFTSSRNGEEPRVWQSTETCQGDNQGTTVERSHQEPYRAPRTQRLRFDAQGNPKLEKQPERDRIVDVSDDKNQEYLEKMEDEYSKREGGA